jgi:hypothetical protein
MSNLVIRVAIAVAALLGGIATSSLWPHPGAVAYWVADGAAAVFVAAVLAGKMLIPLAMAWLPRLCTGGAFVFIAVLASWPSGFGLPLDEWVAHAKLGVAGHVFGLLFAAVAMAITMLIFMTPPAGLS